MLDGFSITIYGPAPAYGFVSTFDITPDITALSFSTALPGGFAGLTVGVVNYELSRQWVFPYGVVPKPFEYRPLGHVVVTYRGWRCFEGRLVTIRRIAGRVVGFTAMGYGLHATWDGVYESTDSNFSNTASSGEILRYILGTCSPVIDLETADFHTGGVNRLYGYFTNKSPAQVIDQLSKEGTGTQGLSVPMDWAVWDKIKASWRRRELPAEPDYRHEEDDDVVRDEDFTNLFTTVKAHGASVDYTYKSFIASNNEAINDYKLTRSTAIDVGGMDTAAAAQQLAVTTLSQVSTPHTALTIQLTGRGLKPFHGDLEMPPWTIRAGKWLQLLDEDYHMIVHTQYDAVAKTLQLTLDNYPHNWVWDAHELRRIAGHVVNGTAPASGASR